jgi:hypothetical protein
VVTITGIFIAGVHSYGEARQGEAVNESSRNYNTSDNNNACRMYFAVGVSE